MKEIFNCVVGSTLYNLNGPLSDIDIKKVSLPSASDLLGLSDTARGHWEQSEPSDTVVYSVAKFFNLLSKCNPTVLELISEVPQECVKYESKEWKDIRNFARKNLVTKKLIPSFMGYVNDQYVRVKARKASNNRTEMIEKHGYDLKSGSHVYRLAVQACEWMLYGMANPRMSGKDREVAFDIKTGKYSFERTIDTLEIAMRGMKDAESKCTLPDAPNMTLVNDFIIGIHQKIVVLDWKNNCY